MFFALEEGGLISALALDVAIEVVGDLASYPLDLLDLVYLSLLKQGLVLGKHLFDCCLEYIRLSLRLQDNLWLIDDYLLFLSLLLSNFLLDHLDDLDHLRTNLDVKNVSD